MSHPSKSYSFDKTETLASDGGPDSDGIGQWYVVEDIARFHSAFITHVIEPVSSGTGKIQLTLGTEAEMEAKTATPVDWSSGSVTAATIETITHQITGFRAVCTVGTIKMSTRAA